MDKLQWNCYCTDTATATGAFLHCTVQPSSPLPYPTPTTYYLLDDAMLAAAMLAAAAMPSFSFAAVLLWLSLLCRWRRLSLFGGAKL